MKFMKKRKIRRIASLFMAVLMVAALMPGSITNTKADDKTAESGVVVDAGTWENNERTTTWNLSINSLNFPLFSRLPAIENSIYVSFSLVFALMG